MVCCHSRAQVFFEEGLDVVDSQEHVAEVIGHVGVVNPANTSRTCSACGHVAKANRASQAVFACVRCGHTEHADINAAKNILARYQARLGLAA